MMRLTAPAITFSFLSKSQNNNPDINYDGNLNEVLKGADDWHNLDPGQLDATGASSSSSGGQFGGGGGQFGGGGGHASTLRGASPNASGKGSACTTTSRRVARVRTT